jgi:hypothetical protein
LTVALLSKWYFNNLVVIEFDGVIFKQINISNRIFMDKIVSFALNVFFNSHKLLESYPIFMIKFQHPAWKDVIGFEEKNISFKHSRIYTHPLFIWDLTWNWRLVKT